MYVFLEPCNENQTFKYRLNNKKMTEDEMCFDFIWNLPSSHKKETWSKDTDIMIWKWWQHSDLKSNHKLLQNTETLT